jgi:hypothetical protein
MTPGTASGSQRGAPDDAFSRVSAALLTVWPQVRDQDAGLSAAERSLVLDECGSDYRPLVELLLDIGRQVRPVLATRGTAPQSAAEWANTRAPMVHRLVATRYLQPDVARWAVDVWGRVVGVAPPPAPPVVLTASGHAASSDSADAVAPTSTGASRTTGAARIPPPRPVVVSPANVPASLRALPSWAGGAVSPRVGTPASALAASRRVVVRAPAAPGPRYQPAERRAAIVLGMLFVTITVAMAQALRNRATGAPPVTEASSTTRSGEPLVALPADSLVPPFAAPADSATAPMLPAGESAAPMRSGTTRPTMDGGTAGDDTLSDETLRALAFVHAGSVIEAGIGGRYLVTPRVRDVSGTFDCDAVAQALAAGRETLEVVTHEPGSRRFTLTTRDVKGTLGADGWFTADPRSGTTNNVNWQFRMRGRFGPDGFSAVSETYTEAILRWGRTQHCVVTAELTGRRLRG